MIAGSVMKHSAFIGLGSNLANPAAQVLQAMQAIGELPDTRVLARSSLYRSAPIGYLDQPDFINAVVKIETTLQPLALLRSMLELEQDNGRTREFKNAPRTLDLDVLMYDDLQHHEHGLTLPHPQMHKRAFVLQPLLEIEPGCLIPGIGSASVAMERCKDQKLQRLKIGAAKTGATKTGALGK